MATYPDRIGATQWAPPPRVIVDRLEARTAAWYEFFPRSAEGSGERGSKLRDCLPRIEYAKAMGFNVIYFPPIHPIGTTNRKGRNNSVTSDPDEPGVPKRVQRGGSFLCCDNYCVRFMAGGRGKGEPESTANHIGFRCVRAVGQPN